MRPKFLMDGHAHFRAQKSSADSNGEHQVKSLKDKLRGIRAQTEALPTTTSSTAVIEGLLLEVLTKLDHLGRELQEVKDRFGLPAMTTEETPENMSRRGDTFTIATMLEMTGTSDTTLNNYAKRAGVPTPRRGRRDHMYSASDAIKILTYAIENSSTRTIIQKCQLSLDRLKTKPKLNPKSK